MLKQCLSAARKRLRSHARLVGIENVDEAAFRSFLLADIKRRNRGARCQTEWNRIDLLIQTAGQNAVIELKFHVSRHTSSVDGTHVHWKGGAGPKNESEFRACVEKLRSLGNPHIHHGFLVLVYERGNSRQSRHSFERSYDNLEKFGVRQSSVIEHPYSDRATCVLIRVA